MLRPFKHSFSKVVITFITLMVAMIGSQIIAAEVDDKISAAFIEQTQNQNIKTKRTPINNCKQFWDRIYLPRCQ